MRTIVAALGLAVLAASASIASAAPSAPVVPGVGPALATPAAGAVQPAGVLVASGYGYGHGYGRPPHGGAYYGRPHHGRPHIQPYPRWPGHGWHGRPRTRIVERPCSTRVVKQTPWGKVVTVYEHCYSRRW